MTNETIDLGFVAYDGLTSINAYACGGLENQFALYCMFCGIRDY